MRARGPEALLAVLLILASGVAIGPGTAAGSPEDPPMADPSGQPMPTPTVVPLANPRLVAALEAEQGDGRERVAVFEDGTLVDSVSYKGRTTTRRKGLSVQELQVIRKICSEAYEAVEEGAAPSVLTDSSIRRIRLELAVPGQKSRFFLFDDATAAPFVVGRVKGAMEDLRSRFLDRTISKEQRWDTRGLEVGAYLKRRSDGKWFQVTRDDTFQPGIELEEVTQRVQRILVPRKELPSLFDSPATERAPAPEPR